MSERVTVNGVELSFGKTFLGRVLPCRVMTTSGRFTSIESVSVDTKAAVIAAGKDSGFVDHAQRHKLNTPKTLAVLDSLKHSRHQPHAVSAAAVAELVLLRRDAMDALARPAPFQSSFEAWDAKIGDLGTGADINNDW